MNKEKALELIEETLEELRIEGQCDFCGEYDYPVNGDERGYDEVLPEDAEGWQIDHSDDCFIIRLENIYKELLGEGK